MSEQKYVCDNGSVGAYAPALPFAYSISSSTPALAGVHTPHERISPHIRAGGSRPPCGKHIKPLAGTRQTAPKAKELTVERHYTRLQERLSTGKSKMPACHGGGIVCSYDLPRMLGRSHPWKPDACVGR